MQTAQTNNYMKAMVLENYGEAFKLKELPVPAPAKGQVLVRIAASGINPLDTKIKRGEGKHAKQLVPAILGLDLAGVVVSTGEGVTSFKTGDEVYGMAGGIGGRQGTLAEYAAVDADLLALKPANLSMREAAALPLVFITAWEGLVDRANVKADQRVLIHGGAGGIGHVAIQLARSFGASVFATGSSKSLQVIESLGATPIDYNSLSVKDYVEKYTAGEGFDIVFDTVGGETLDKSFEAVRNYTGHVVSALGWGSHSLAPLSFRGATYSGVFTLLPMLTGKGMKHHGDILREAARLAENGQLKPLLDKRTLALGEAEAAYKAIESGATTGKLVVNI
ncbi:zinc-dependent alcohol dehydrogenase family protein [Chitinophaga ginsengisoli]|uniref:NADPH:quinone reductase-like Zn-dependent oxidoreductase n=1 Tax=Chitinophaga ginsengisoli TaxID=363837 RepID=A0A2P8GE45_9BACT|nr:zinc-dependent alcohol dehydrogenase family protein [Chitinophaga ginsengisoli]PSL32249.1 NADPH:quinone reductase-like Zn-dependent oxidoreductase [Chitinophaga ginsengisoli]